jgi:HK97 family phage major capsid protein
MELERKLDELGRAFEEFKKANDSRIEEIKTKGHASSETTEKVEKANQAIAGLEAKIEQMSAAIARTAQGGADVKAQTEEQKQAEEYKKGFVSFMRKGGDMTEAHKEFAKKSMSVQVDEDGGFFVTPEMSAEIVTKVFESNPMRELSSVQVISSDSLDIMQDLDEASSGWVGETAARTATDTPQLKKINIPVHELYANPQATQKLLDDAAVNVEAWLAAKVSEKFARDEAAAFISGNGFQKPKGVLSYTSGTSFNQIERHEALDNTTLDGNDFIGIQSKLKEPYQGNSTWLINRLIIGEIRKLKDTNTGQYIWQPGLTVGQPGTLLGRPVRMATELASTLNNSNEIAIYGDFRAGYQIVDRVGIRVLRDPYTNKPYVGFYTTKRVGGGVKNFEALKVLIMKAS